MPGWSTKAAVRRISAGVISTRAGTYGAPPCGSVAVGGNVFEPAGERGSGPLLQSGAARRCPEGSAQRIGLARAVYGAPSLVVLDEPNASLDAEGEDALRAALIALKTAGTTVVLVAHRPNLVTVADQILVAGHRQCRREGGPRRRNALWHPDVPNGGMIHAG